MVWGVRGGDGSGGEEEEGGEHVDELHHAVVLLVGVEVGCRMSDDEKTGCADERV